MIKATQGTPKIEAKREQQRTTETPRQTSMELSPVEQIKPVIKKTTLKRSDLGPKPAVANAPQDILRAWTALEVLSPQGFKRESDLTAGDNSRIARFDERDLPWNLGEKSRPKKRLYYELILGAVALAPAVEELLKLYSDDRPDKPSMKGFCPIASILLDKEGRPLEEETSAAISSFAWGVPIALQGDLRSLADWPQQERQLINCKAQRGAQTYRAGRDRCQLCHGTTMPLQACEPNAPLDTEYGRFGPEATADSLGHL